MITKEFIEANKHYTVDQLKSKLASIKSEISSGKFHHTIVTNHLRLQPMYEKYIEQRIEDEKLIVIDNNRYFDSNSSPWMTTNTTKNKVKFECELGFYGAKDEFKKRFMTSHPQAPIDYRLLNFESVGDNLYLADFETTVWYN